MSLLKPSEYLIRVKDKVATPDKWFHGKTSTISWTQARRQGKTCIGVAIEDVTKSENMQTKLRGLIKNFVPYNNIVDWNDAFKTTHPEVLKVLDQAIALAKKREERWI